MSLELQDAVTLAQSYALQPQTLAEATLETAISVTCVELALATSEAEQREIFERIRGLHQQRTPGQVERLELQRGLRK